MRLLFDQNLSFKLCRLLSDLWPGSQHVGVLGMGDTDDRLIWNYAVQNGLTIVTQDVDYANLSVLLGSPPQVVWLRCGNQPTTKIEQLLRQHYDALMALNANPALGFIEVFP